MLRRILVCLAASCLVPGQHMADDFPEVRNSDRERELHPLPPDEAARTMRVPEGFRVTLFAAEPQVRNPIAMAWDDQGRLWVAENYTYSDRTQRFDLTLRDRVLIFADENHDGRADARTVFTDDIQMLTSVEVGRGGVWLMCPPRLLFVPDADGDDIPDGPARVELDGFDVAQDNYHNFANGLRWGPDGWLYGRCGHSCPGRIGVPGTPAEERVPLDGGIWRYHPDRRICEVLCHGTVNPWGHDWDRHGELFFINTVIGHVWHVLPGAHFRESFGESANPAVYSRLDTIADHYHFDTRGSWTDSRDGAANDLGGGHAHIGMMIYQHGAWPEQYRDRLVTLNMHGRRANVDRLERRGAGYVARHDPDFFLSADPFFRGLEISVGPDGNVYVLDWSDTGECHEHDGVHRTSGRIFKISYGPDRSPQPMPKPSCLAAGGNLSDLWRRYQAGQTSPEELRGLLSDPDEHVRVWAIRLLTDFWPLDTIVGPPRNAVYPDDPATRARLVQVARDDPSGLVQLALASTLQRLPVEHRTELAAELVRQERYADDRDLPLLVWFGLIPVGDRDPQALLRLAGICRWPDTTRCLARNLASRVESQPQWLEALLRLAPTQDAPLQRAVLTGISEAYRGWRRVPRPAAWEQIVASDLYGRHTGVGPAVGVLWGGGRAWAAVGRTALDEKLEIRIRQVALQTLIDAHPEDLRDICQSLLGVRFLNGIAVRGLARFEDPEIGVQLIRNYRRFHPDDRSAVLTILVSRPSYARVLLDRVGSGSGQIPPEEITAFHARQIRSLGDEDLNRRLAAVWGEVRESPAERQTQIARLREELTAERMQQADVRAGRALFAKTCATCHLLFGAGKKIGPDLTGSQRATLDYLLQNIVDPSAVVGKDYRMSVVTTADGRVLNGLVVSRNDRTLVLQTPTSQETIPIDEIEELRETALSSMPDELLVGLTPDQIRDLVAYLMHPSQVPLP